LHLYEREGWSIIEISGELDLQGVPELRELLLRSGHRLVLDARGVAFVDCSGLRTIVGPVTGEGRRRVVAEENGHLHRLLRLTGWERSVLLYPSVAAALRPPSAR
jgi:anti-anti-sigma factor